jgi:HSP20 family protein
MMPSCYGMVFSRFLNIKLIVMANLTKRSTSGYADPWRDFFDLDLWGHTPQRNNSLPAVNISEDDKNFTVEVAAPGFKKEDFKLNVEDDILTISAETKQENVEGGNGKQYSRREYSYSSFTRSFHLPENAKDDSINAKYENGILKIMIPKTKEQQKATKQINIE